MGIETGLAKYGPTGVAIAVLIALIIIIGYFIKQIDKQRKNFLEYTECLIKIANRKEDRLRKTIDHNTRIQIQVFEFLKNLNGDLRRSVRKKIRN